ncbi:hypothetical protein SKAU_G00142150 [Synaphobranchus kaupii]|uniref:Uncharacterized protein n=1 Tax=Synaphobranchus kaupii TaxID=118154 RepID=A0A9Q1FSY2_SYNKA|nr:hypothetical protein SKAU_G00142150 [Synaphobranchus kaupii]
MANELHGDSPRRDSSGSETRIAVRPGTRHFCADDAPPPPPPPPARKLPVQAGVTAARVSRRAHLTRAAFRRSSEGREEEKGREVQRPNCKRV